MGCPGFQGRSRESVAYRFGDHSCFNPGCLKHLGWVLIIALCDKSVPMIGVGGPRWDVTPPADHGSVAHLQWEIYGKEWVTALFDGLWVLQVWVSGHELVRVDALTGQQLLNVQAQVLLFPPSQSRGSYR